MIYILFPLSIVKLFPIFISALFYLTLDIFVHILSSYVLKLDLTLMEYKKHHKIDVSKARNTENRSYLKPLQRDSFKTHKYQKTGVSESYLRFKYN